MMKNFDMKNVVERREKLLKELERQAVLRSVNEEDNSVYNVEHFDIKNPKHINYCNSKQKELVRSNIPDLKFFIAYSKNTRSVSNKMFITLNTLNLQIIVNSYLAKEGIDNLKKYVTAINTVTEKNDKVTNDKTYTFQ